MNKSVIGIIIALLIVGGIAAGLLLSNGDRYDSAVTTTGSDSQQQEKPAKATTQNQSTSTQNSSGISEAKVVNIENFAYSPQTMKVKVGSTVTWVNKDSDRHDITPDTETAEFKASNLLSKNQTYSVTFNTPGTYSYFCSPHPYMTASVEVVE